MSEHTTQQDEWDRRFLAMAGEVAEWSKDPDCKVGAVIVSASRRQLSVGYNGFVRGGDDDYSLETVGPPGKLDRTVHAELNCIINAGASVSGCTLYCTKFPCLACANAAIQAGIARVVAEGYETPGSGSKWVKSHMDALRAMTLAGVEVNARAARRPDDSDATELWDPETPERMEALARWLDLKHPADGDGVQRSLRAWARELRRETR